VSKKVTIQQFAAQPTSDFSMVSFRKSYAWFALLSYFRKHLRSVNGLVESIFGRWHGLGAEQLGLAQGSAVTEEQFGRLCKNQHPTLTKTGVLGFGTAVRLTARKFFTREDGPSRIACYSFVFCPPKSVSITSMFDTRIEPLHNKWVEATLDEMQKDAKGRVRKRGADFDRHTGNLVVALFNHTRSRAGDPLLHTHAQVFNATFDPIEKQWKALQAFDIGKRAGYYTALFQNGLAHDLRALGYSLRVTKHGFEIEGVSQADIEFYSKRSKAMKKEAESWVQKKVEETRKSIHSIGKAGMAVVARLTRPKKLVESETSTEALAAERSEPGGLTLGEKMAKVVEAAKAADAPGVIIDPDAPRLIDAKSCIDFARDHCFERSSVVTTDELMKRALSYSKGRVSNETLTAELASREEFIKEGKEVTLRKHLAAEEKLVSWVNAERNAHPGFVTEWVVSEHLNDGQQKAVQALLSSTDGVVAMRGGPGSGKSHVTAEVMKALKAKGYVPVVLAPTREAVVALNEKGVSEAITLQHFMLSEPLQLRAQGQPILVDEAGKLSLNDFERLQTISAVGKNRLMLIGDTKQHSSVQAGDGLRILEKFSQLESVNLDQVVRQTNQDYRHAAQLLSEGKVTEGVRALITMGAVKCGHADWILEAASRDYYRSLQEGKNVVVVTPTWEEATSIGGHIRALLKQNGKIGKTDYACKAFENFHWTEAQRLNFSAYTAGMMLTFHTKTLEFEQGETVKIKNVTHQGALFEMEVAKEDSTRATVTRKHVKAYTVGKETSIQLTSGDKILVQANQKQRRLINGHIDTVKGFDAQGRIHLEGGGIMMPSFLSFCHAYALPSTRVQGATVEHVILATLKESKAANDAAFLVGATRGTQKIQVYAPSKKHLRTMVDQKCERLSATEFMSLKEARAQGHAVKVPDSPNIKVKV
jgi:conjugative relaxase-like TrwC/TraI family protein